MPNRGDLALNFPVTGLHHMDFIAWTPCACTQTRPASVFRIKLMHTAAVFSTSGAGPVQFLQTFGRKLLHPEAQIATRLYHLYRCKPPLDWYRQDCSSRYQCTKFPLNLLEDLLRSRLLAEMLRCSIYLEVIAILIFSSLLNI